MSKYFYCLPTSPSSTVLLKFPIVWTVKDKIASCAHQKSPLLLVTYCTCVVFMFIRKAVSQYQSVHVCVDQIILSCSYAVT